MPSKTKRKRRTVPLWKGYVLFIELLLIAVLFFIFIYQHYHPVQFEIPAESGSDNYTCIIHQEAVYCCDPYSTWETTYDNSTEIIKTTKCWKRESNELIPSPTQLEI